MDGVQHTITSSRVRALEVQRENGFPGPGRLGRRIYANVPLPYHALPFFFC